MGITGIRTSAGAAVCLLALTLAGCSDDDGGKKITDIAASKSASKSPSAVPTTDSPGGTAISLTAERPIAGPEVEVVRKRVEALGLHLKMLRVEGNKIALKVTEESVPADKVKPLGRKESVEFRPVTATNSAGPASADVQAKLDALDCAKSSADIPAKPEAPTVACQDADQNTPEEKFVLGPVEISGADVTMAEAALSEAAGGWQIRMSMTAAAGERFTKLTGQLATQPSPLNRFAILDGGKVLSAPAVMSAIPGGNAVISGKFTQESAKELAGFIGAGVLSGGLTVEVTK